MSIPDKICVQCRKPKKVIRKYKWLCLNNDRSWKRHKFYVGTYEVGKHSNQAALADEMRHKILMIRRRSFREGQLDILKKVLSIFRACNGDRELTAREVKTYCEDYKFDVEFDRQITNDIINQKKLT